MSKYLTIVIGFLFLVGCGKEKSTIGVAGKFSQSPQSSQTSKSAKDGCIADGCKLIQENVYQLSSTSSDVAVSGSLIFTHKQGMNLAEEQNKASITLKWQQPDLGVKAPLVCRQFMGSLLSSSTNVSIGYWADSGKQADCQNVELEYTLHVNDMFAADKQTQGLGLDQACDGHWGTEIKLTRSFQILGNVMVSDSSDLASCPTENPIPGCQSSPRSLYEVDLQSYFFTVNATVTCEQ